MTTKIDQSTSITPTKSLSWTLTKASLFAVVIGMSAYTTFEIASSGKLDLMELFTHHLLPTLLIGIIIWGVLSFLLRSKVVNPVREILAHLNYIGAGRFAPLEKSSEIREIRQLISGVNSLTIKLKNAPDSNGTSKAIDDLVQLRADLKAVIDQDQVLPDHLVPIMKDLKTLEGHLLSALQTGQ